MHKLFINSFFLVILLHSNLSAGTNSPDIDTLNFGINKIYLLDKWDYMHQDEESQTKSIDSDSKWSKIDLLQINFKLGNPGVHLLRSRIFIKENISSKDILAFTIYNFQSAYEIYWDGILIGGNGTVGHDGVSEIVGSVRYNLVVGREFTKAGNHIIEIRVSNFNQIGNKFFAGIFIGYNSNIRTLLDTRLEEHILYMGIFFTAALFCISVFIGGWRNKSFLIFGTYMFFYFILSLWIYLIESELVDNNVFSICESIFYYGVILAVIILNVFIYHFFEIRKKWLHFLIVAGITVLSIAISSNWDDLLRFRIISIVLYIYAFVIILGKMRKKAPGTNFIFAGIGLMLVYTIILTIDSLYNFLDFPFLANAGINILFTSLIIISISRKIQEQNKRYHEMLLKSQRLENQLLKKTIQPHFISNTLLSIKSWLSINPEKAEKIIETLSEEFQLINYISSKKEISLKEEIELCKHHLEIMGYRMGAGYKLITEGINFEDKIPPMTFHTLIENGLTHSYESKEDGIFKLACTKSGNSTTYIMTNNGSRLKRFSGRSSTELEEGFGLRYVKSRLEESYPGRWNVEYGLNNELWEVKIVITN